MSIRDTSREAYAGVYPHLGRMQWVVLDAIKKNGGVTRQGLVNIIGKPINCITGRVKELLEKKLIQEVGKVNKQYRLFATTLLEVA
jgi:predicted HTH transcriptional regulator